MAWTETHVTPLGAGAHDGTSKANAWTPAEMVTALTGLTGSSVICNWYSDQGTYTFGSAFSFPLTVSSNRGRIMHRGCHTTPGDLDAQGRLNGWGFLDTTNFPLLDAQTFGITARGGNIFRRMQITSNRNGATLTGASSENTEFMFCHLSNTRVGNGVETVYAPSAPTGTRFINCDIVSSSTGLQSVISAEGTIVMHCRIWNTGGTGIGVSMTSVNVLYRNAIFNVNRGVSMASGTHTLIGNVFHNTVTSAILYVAGVGTALITNNLAYNIGAYFIDWSATGSGRATTPGVLNNATGALTSGVQTGLETEQVLDPVTLLADPFIDAANQDFRLNDVATGGRLCKFAGSHGGDIGIFQHEPLSSGGLLIHPGMCGGFRG